MSAAQWAWVAGCVFGFVWCEIWWQWHTRRRRRAWWVRLPLWIPEGVRNWIAGYWLRRAFARQRPRCRLDGECLLDDGHEGDCDTEAYT
jgi:hypothetical protein